MWVALCLILYLEKRYFKLSAVISSMSYLLKIMLHFQSNFDLYSAVSTPSLTISKSLLPIVIVNVLYRILRLMSWTSFHVFQQVFLILSQKLNAEIFPFSTLTSSLRSIRECEHLMIAYCLFLQFNVILLTFLLLTF